MNCNNPLFSIHTAIFVTIAACFLLIFSSCNNSTAMEETVKFEEKDIEQHISPFDHPDEPGMLVRIYDHGNIVFDKAIGLADLSSKKPMDMNATFPIGSVSKEFNMVSIMKLIEDGKIHLSDTVGKYVDDLPFGSTITIEQLLDHTSGIKNYFEKEGHMPAKLDSAFTPQELVEYFKGDTLDFKPGTAYKYGNSDYVLLALIIEKLKNESYPTHLEKDFFSPLGMKDTYSSLDQDAKESQISGYNKDGTDIQPAMNIHPTQTYGVGSIISTVDDMYTWHSKLLNGKILSDSAFALAETPGKIEGGDINSEYRGFTLMTGNIGGRQFFWNAGDIAGIHTRYLYFPKEDIYITVITNVTVSDLHDHGGNVMFKIAGELFKEESVFVIGREYILSEL
ncbi:serine hydrolase domain-containing protein [Roseivirga sp. BDSF3-8]|uniref:serine hydrolase domain-containing protein n=1 Tax=Roseivirga sp. BDSF3-8 TaxID=3241598 RepID=UPI0035324C09